MKRILKLMLIVMLAVTVCTLASCTLFGGILPQSHFYNDSVVPPTCTEQGYTLHECRHCDESYQDNFVEALGHGYEAVKTVGPTCTEQGYTTYQCSRCEASYQDDVVDALGHSYELTQVVAPNCNAEGYTEYTCSVCSEVKQDDAVASLTHRYNGGACLNCEADAPADAIEANVEWYDESTAVFVLKTKEELAGFAQLVNEGADFVGRTVRLGADIDLGYAEWTPIGTGEHPFTGTFSGEKYTVSGLKITATGAYVGLFGNVKGTIRDLNVTGASIYAPDTVQYVGVVAGKLNGQLTAVSAQGYVDARTSEYVGGLVGYVSSSASFTDLASGVAVVGGSYTGGIIGQMQIGGAIVSTLAVTAPITGADFVGGAIGSLVSDNVVFVEKITVTADVYGDVKVGGAVGHIEGKVSSNIKNVSVSAGVSGTYYVGGLIGRAVNVALEDSTNAGSSVEARDCLIEGTNFYAYLGGYVGCGYSVKGCNNAVELSYASRGMYVGGIAGYLTADVHDCENSAPIKGYANVGGIVGAYANAAAANLYNLKNTGAVTGVNNLGGIFGLATPKATLSLTSCENTGAITAEEGTIGGIGGSVNGETYQLTAKTLKNTGAITAKKSHVGGLFGNVLVNENSVISESVSSADVSGLYCVGGLVGYASKATLNACSNEGSSVSATGWKVEGTEMYVCLGGYIGREGGAVNCTNDVAIEYTGIGMFVGGIIGFADKDIKGCKNNAAISSHGENVGGIVGKTTAVLTDCENNGDISSQRSLVGGIAGEARNNVTVTRTYSGLVNNGAVSGLDKVGGIFGDFWQELDYGSCGGYNVPVNFNDMKNTGAVNGQNKVGGIVGRMRLNNTKDYRCSIHVSWENHNTYSYFRLVATGFTNTGVVGGVSEVGELFGYFWTDGKSTVTTYTVLGQKTVNGEVLDAEGVSYDVGASTNLTLSGRNIYVAPTPDVEQTPGENEENTENGENEESTEA